jgi:predicted aconitase
MSELHLDDRDQAARRGDLGEASRHAMEIVIAYGEMVGATGLIDVTSAHIDACLHHGLAGVEFAEFLRDRGGQVSVPSTLNVSSLDLLHPELYRGDETVRAEAQRMMDAYVQMGCSPTWTCAPYQLPVRPGLGEHVAWAESNAIVFANSVLGARTERYGDFFDIAAAIVGRVPDAGLHREENRYADTVVDVTDLFSTDRSEVLYPAVGLLVGKHVDGIPAIVGLPNDTTEDHLKALGAAGATAGTLAMFHAVGLTPEAPDLDTALGGSTTKPELRFTRRMAIEALRSLTTGSEGPLVGVSIGTPHFSISEMRRTVEILDGRTVDDRIDLYVSTGRETYATARAEGLVQRLEEAGVDIVVDTCTYVTPILRKLNGSVMTNSAKWAYYAPGNLGVEVVFGSLEDCIESAIAGRVVHGESGWTS